MTAQTMPARAATGGRDRYFDVLRTACILWVVVYHIANQDWLGFWPAMGLLFAISGSLMVRSLDRGALKTIKNRLQRLLPVLWLAAVIGVPLMFWHGWPADERPPLWRLVFWIFPLSDPPGSEWATSLTEPLWYMRSIVWFILLSPILLILFRWYPKTMIAIPLAVMVGFAFGKIGFGWSGDLGEGVLTDGFTFLALWLLGFAHREGMLKKIPVWAVVTMGLILAGFATYWAFTHQEENSYDFNQIPAGQALYSFGIVLILLRFAPKFSWVGKHKVLDRTITIINGRAMVIYLWHNVAIELSYPLGDKINVWGVGEKIGLADHGEAVGTAICAVIAVLLTIAGMLAFGWIEDVAAQRRPQLLPKDLGKKSAGPAEPPAAPADAAPTSPAPAAAATPGMNDSTVTFAAVPDQNGAYSDRRPGWPDERYQPAAPYGSPVAPQQPDHSRYQRGHEEPRYDDNRYDDRYDDRRRPEPRYDEPRYDDRYAPSNYDDRRADAYRADAYRADAYRAEPYDGRSVPDQRRAPAEHRAGGGAAVPPGRQYGAPRRSSDRDDDMAWNAYPDGRPDAGVPSFDENQRGGRR